MVITLHVIRYSHSFTAYITLDRTNYVENIRFTQLHNSNPSKMHQIGDLIILCSACLDYIYSYVCPLAPLNNCMTYDIAMTSVCLKNGVR